MTKFNLQNVLNPLAKINKKQIVTNITPCFLD